MAADNDLSDNAAVDLELEKEGNRDSAPQSGTGDDPENNEIRQGETPEVQPHSAVLYTVPHISNFGTLR
jgi:hypothetical protein